MTTFPANDIIQFWFSDCVDEPENLNTVARRWYSGGEVFDREIAAKFGYLFETVPKQLLTETEALSAQQLLAGIVLFDQFSRNCFRRSARAFEYDVLSLQLMDTALARGLHQRMHPLHCVFLLMPLQHAEDLKRQDSGVKLFQGLVDRSAEPYRSYIKGTARYAAQHRELIERFGRFPHRNKVLMREPSEQELRYLESGGRTFGQ